VIDHLNKGWKKIKLGAFVSLFGGAAFKSQDATSEGIKWLKIANVGFGNVKWDVTEYLSIEFTKGYQRYLLQAPDIVVAMTRPVLSGYLKVARLRPCDGVALLNQRVAKVIVDDGIDSEFLLQHLFTRRLASSLELALSGTDPPNLSASVLDDITIPLPPLPEQQKIATILSTWDRAIELTEKLIVAKQKRKQALMRQLFTGKVRLPGFEKTKWKKCHLNDVAKNSTGRSGVSTDDRTVYSVTNSVGMVPMNEGVIGESLERYKTVRKFDFAYNPMRINVGSITMWEGDEEVLVSPDYVVFRCGSKLDAQFLNHFRRTHYWRHFVNRAGGGSVRVRIYFSDLGSLKLNLPPVEEQKAIAEVLNAQDSEIELLSRRLDALKRQKKGLMQQLLTGKVRVNVDTKAIKAAVT
jgi:type I restriction enzyme S subunit